MTEERRLSVVKNGAACAEVVTFEDQNIEIIDMDGGRWVMLRDLGRALGYTEARDLKKVFERHAEEFEGKLGWVSLTTPGGVQEFRTINYHGVIRASMLARTPKAKAFRDWAEEVLFSVMMTGRYVGARNPEGEATFQAYLDNLKTAQDNVRIEAENASNLTQLMMTQSHSEKILSDVVKALTGIIERQDSILKNQTILVEWMAELATTRKQRMIPAQTERLANRRVQGLLPSQRVRSLIHPNDAYWRFNTGGSFDKKLQFRGRVPSDQELLKEYEASRENAWDRYQSRLEF